MNTQWISYESASESDFNKVERWCEHDAAGAEVPVQQRQENGTPLWREAHFQVNMHKRPHARTALWSSNVKKWHAAVWREAHLQVKMFRTPQLRAAFWSSDVEKCKAAVARSAFASQNALNTFVLAHFGAYDVEKVSDRRDRKVDTQSVN